MTDKTLEVILKFLIDKNSLAAVKDGTLSLEEALKKADSERINAFLQDADKQLARLEQINQKYKEQREEVGKLRNLSRTFGRIGGVTLGMGTAITAPMLLSAKNYIAYIEQAGIKTDSVANRWIAANEKIKNANLNVGRSVANAVLPYMERAASLIERVAAKVNQNPQAVNAIFGTGVAMTVMGTLAIAVSKGIKIYADVKYAAATAEFTLATANFQRSVHEFLLGQKMPAGSVAGGGGGSLTTILSSIFAIGVGAAVSKAIIDALNVALSKTEFGNRIDEAQKAAAEGGKGYPGINVYSRAVKDAEKNSQNASRATDDLSNGLRDYIGEAEKAANAAKGMEVLTALQNSLLNSERQYQEQRESVIRNSNTQMANAARQYGRNITRITENLNRNLRKIAEDYQKQSVDAEVSYNQQRADIIRNAGEQIRQIEAQLQEDLRNLRLEHEERVADLTAQRDALGLVRERRSYERQVAERERAANQQIAQLKRETAIQLMELRRRYDAEREQRYAEYQQRIKEAQEQAELEKAELRKSYADQMSELRQAKAEQLAELQRAHQEETRRLVEEAYNQVRQLDGAMLAERTIRQKYYGLMLSDAEAFMQSLKTKYSTSSNASSSKSGKSSNNIPLPYYPSRQSGGYVENGIYRLHNNEYVMDAETTRVAEQAVGGRLGRNNLGKLFGGTTINLQFPGGLVTVKELKNILRQNNSSLINALAGALNEI